MIDYDSRQCAICGRKDSTPELSSLCDSCDKDFDLQVSKMMFAKSQQPTNREIDAARSKKKSLLQTCRDELLDLLISGKLGDITTINDVFKVLNSEIENYK